MSERILFCNIAYMEYYDIDLFEETPEYGGAYVAETGDALEKYNFHVCEDGMVRGFVETKYRDSYTSAKKPNKLNIENIDAAYKNENSISDVTVVFCAHSKFQNKSVIVGWYKNATVFRGREEYNGRQFNIECNANDKYLLTSEKRSMKVPRAKQDSIGFGQSNIWYAKDDKAYDYVCRVLEYIDKNCESLEYSNENIPQIISDEYEECGVGQKVLVNKYERNQNARRKCLEIYGTNCFICGFNSREIYGEEFVDKIEVHHRVPIHEINEAYKISPEKDLVPVCPNCHMILHTKMQNGEYPTIEYLKSKL